jgi:hypothetical protein
MLADVLQAGESVGGNQWPSDLPDNGKGAIDVSWIAPYVQTSQAFGKTIITWFTKDNQVERQATVNDVNPVSGFTEIIGHPNEVVGINEDWRIRRCARRFHAG